MPDKNILHKFAPNGEQYKQQAIGVSSEALFIFMAKRDDYRDKAIVVNLIGGPGCGKSILTSELFAEFKRRFISAEISPEYIKKKLREKSQKAVQSQIYIFGKQQYQLFSMKDEVDVIVTDSPFILSSIYDSSNCNELRTLIVKEFNKYNNMTYYIERDEQVPYEQEGRYQDSEGAKKVDTMVFDFLVNNNIEFKTVKGIGNSTKKAIIKDVIKKLDERKKSEANK